MVTHIATSVIGGISMRRTLLLIVEDHEGTRTALAAIFHRRGIEVRTATTVAEGLAALEPPPDCAVVDLMLPDGDGEEVVRAIKGRDLPTCIVVCSGTGDEGRLAAIGELKVQAVLRKPIAIDAIFAACDKLLQAD